MSRSLPLYATGSDILGLLVTVESQHQVWYVVAGASAQQTPVVFDSSRQLPNLGSASAGAQERETLYLVMDSSDGVEARIVAQRGARFFFDQQSNPRSVILRPGGVFEDKCIIAGQVCSSSSAKESDNLLKLFSTEIRRRFTKVRAYYVGDEALRLLDKGMRLTNSVRAPAEYDLKRE